ncbi:hypothetical protein BGW38_004221 [Lunasporangiospora selenospora]|uniref:Uncharacterized protein n=1 Tax=Lunasporangiospora selenospora TaxID=979761 RepID=A0A9P6FQS8_9FUNG|nr:hypothetical protein BGW38_004221 [Lunasporangiospora selenospora]
MNSIAEVSGLTRRSSRQRQRSSSISVARVSDDSWPDLYPLTSVITQKSLLSDSGYSGMTDGGTTSGGSSSVHFDSSPSEETLLVEGDENEYAKTNLDMDDVAKAIEVLSIAQASHEAALTESEDASSETKSLQESAEIQGEDQFEDPESLKGSTTIESASNSDQKECDSQSSSTSSSPSGRVRSNESDSSDDDQPIILSRRGSSNRGGSTSAGAGVGSKAATSVTFAPNLLNDCDEEEEGEEEEEEEEDLMVTPPPSTMGYIPQVTHAAPYHQFQHHQNYQAVAGIPQSMAPMATYVQQPVMHHHQPMATMGTLPVGYHQMAAAPAHVTMGHQHTYSFDRIPGGMMTQGSPISHVSRHARPGYGSKDMRQGVLSPVGGIPANSHHHHQLLAGQGMMNIPGSPIQQTQFSIPATAILHPMPRRTQSVRMRSGAPFVRTGSPSRQMAGMGGAQAIPHQQVMAIRSSAGVGARSSMDLARSPNGGYQAVPSGLGGVSNPGGYGAMEGSYLRGYAESMASQQAVQNSMHHPQGIMMSPPMAHAHLEKQIAVSAGAVPGYYPAMTAAAGTAHHFGYSMHPNDPQQYMMATAHQPILQAARR